MNVKFEIMLYKKDTIVATSVPMRGYDLIKARTFVLEE